MAAEFFEMIRLTGSVRILRVGYWWHIVYRETGERKWEWHGPEKRRELAEPGKFS